MEGTDFQTINQFLGWAIGGLITIIIPFIVALYLKSVNARLKDKDEVIERLEDSLKEERAENLKLIAEIRPTMKAANTIANNILNLLTNAKK